MLITALETQLSLKVIIDWIGIVVSGPPFVLSEVIDEKWATRTSYCYVKALAYMNEQDVNGNGWPGSGCYIDGYLCSVVFYDVFYLILVSGKGSS